MLALSLNFRLIAVKLTYSGSNRIKQGKDSLWPYFNNHLDTKNDKIEMVEKLKHLIINSKTYKSKPEKRVMIPSLPLAANLVGLKKAKCSKKRHIPLPSIEDRCLQTLINLVLLPLVEITSDPHSYGNRAYRNAKMALGTLRYNLKSEEAHYDKWVLNANITGFFDNISHDWLLGNIPLEIGLKSLLKS